MIEAEPGEPPEPILVFAAPDVGYSELYWFLKSLQGRGLLDRLLLLCPGRFFDVHPDAVPFHIDDDCSDAERTCERIAAWIENQGRRVSGVIGVDEDRQFELSRKIAARFGVPFHGAAACRRASNKYVQKRRFEALGVPTAPFVLTDDSEDPSIAHLGFPCVVKTVTGYGSQFLRRCDGPEDVRTAFERIRREAREANHDPRFRRRVVRTGGQTVAIDPGRQLLVERWVGGREFSCDFVVEGARVQVVRVARKVPGRHFGFFDGTKVLGSAEIESSGVGIGRLTTLCGRIRRALGVRHGVCMVDFKLDHGHLYVLEASIRPGLSATNHAVYALYGYTPLALLAMQRMGVPVSVEIPPTNAAVVYLHGGGSAIDEAAVAHLRDRHGPDGVYIYSEVEDPGQGPAGDPSTLIRGYVVLTGVDGEPWTSVAARARAGTVRRRGRRAILPESGHA